MCTVHHVKAVELHCIVSVVLDVIHFLRGKCEVFCIILIFTFIL